MASMSPRYSSGSLTRASADARIDTRLVDLGIILNPAQALAEALEFRFDDPLPGSDSSITFPADFTVEFESETGAEVIVRKLEKFGR